MALPPYSPGHRAASPVSSAGDSDDDAGLPSPPPLRTSSRQRAPPSTGSRHRLFDFLDEAEAEAAEAPTPSTAAGSARPPVPTSVGRVSAVSPARSVHSVASIGSARSTATTRDQVKAKLVAMTVELEDKTKTVQALRAALAKARADADERAAQAERRAEDKAAAAAEEMEAAMQRQLGFVDRLLADKEELARRCELLAAEVKRAEQRRAEEQAAARGDAERELKRARESWAAAEKLRREQWVETKTKEIKAMTVKGLEPEIHRLLSKHKTEMRRAREQHEAELSHVREQAELSQETALRRQREKLAPQQDAALADAEARWRGMLHAKQREAEAEAERLREAWREDVDAERQRARAELRTEQERHAEAMADARAAEQDRLQELLVRHSDEMAAALRRKADEADAELRREQSAQDDFKRQLEARLRAESARELEHAKRALADERDAKIDVVIGRLQAEARDRQRRVEEDAAAQIEDLRAEHDAELDRLREGESSWKAKYLTLFRQRQDDGESAEAAEQRLASMQQQLQAALARATAAEARVEDADRRADAREADLTREHAERLSRDKAGRRDLEQQLEDVRAELARLQDGDADRVQRLREEHEDELERVHVRVRTALAKKDETIAVLRDELETAEMQRREVEGRLERQREELVG